MRIQHGGEFFPDRKVLDFSVNVNPLGMPESVKTALRDSAGYCASYPDASCRKLAQAVSGRLGLPPEYLVFGNGAADLIFRLVWAVKPKRVLIPAPAFAEYEQAVKSAGGSVRHLPLERSAQFQMNERISTFLTEDTDILFLCNPNNPTGQVVGRELLCRILDECLTKHILVVLDECFMDLTENGAQYTMRAYLGQYHNLLILNAFTKSYAMAGLRLGYAMSRNAALLETVRDAGQPWSVSVPAQYAGIAACLERGYLASAQTLISRERDFLTKGLNMLGFDVIPSCANFICFRTKDDRLKEKLLGHSILIRSCANFIGMDAFDYRIAVRTHAENRKLIHALTAVTAGGQE